MSSLNALKYKVHIKRSYYAGAAIFLLYLFVILVSFRVVSASPVSLFLYLLLFLIAVYAANKAYQQQGELALSDSGLVECIAGDKTCSGKIGRYSLYNGLFIFLHLDIQNSAFTQQTSKHFITIYKDAISEEQYRLIARLINNGRN